MIRSFVLLLAAASVAAAQIDHVRWEFDCPTAAAPGSKFVAKLRATIDPEWHLYSLTTPQPGPIATTIRLRDQGGKNIAAVRVFQPKPTVKFDPNFGRDTETYVNGALFYVEVTLQASAMEIPLELVAEPRYQICSSTSCIPPVTRTAAAFLNVTKKAPAANLTIPGEYQEVPNPGGTKSTAAKVNAEAPLSAGVAGASTGSGDSPWAFVVTAFGFGLAAIFTPCVFPMMPITVSYFLNQQGEGPASRGKALQQAVLFCLGIVVLFSALGLITTSVLGPFGVVRLGSNPWVNALIAAIFVVFGLSLLGAYEITIPSAVLSKLDSASRGGGSFGTLLMGLTFSLASFACVGPFVGPLLAASATGGGWRPPVGMAVFASGLALPFFLLALFPSYLKKLPKSGGWLARVKVVMGFVIIAAALKYLASIDQVMQWNVLTRERFLAAWIVLFAMAGLYLLGFLRLEGVGKDEHTGLARLFAGMAFVVFAITLVPGMFGGKLGELEGFVPPPSASSGLGGAASAGTELAWLKNDFAGAVAKARAEHKRVLVNFTGYACTNCHWMKQNMFTKPEIAAVLHNMVLVDLFTDSDDATSQANQKMEESLFHTIAIPFYAVYDPGTAGDAQLVATFPSLTRDAAQYVSFLNTPTPPSAVVAAATPASGSGPFPGVKTLAGGALDQGALSGKVVVANFWATWCVPCRKEIPDFNKLHSSMAGKGVEVLGISLDDDGAEVIKPFLEKNPIHYQVALASDAIKSSYKLDQLPVTVVLNRKGEVVERFEGLTAPEKILGAVGKVL